MPEKKYIDADHLLTALSVFNDHDNGNPHFLNGIRTAEEIIKDAPAADVRPVKRGEWVGEYDGYADGMPVYDMWSCSVCGKRFDEWDERPSWSFCPNCGADMRKTSKNE